MLLVLFNPPIGPYKVLPRWAGVELGSMAMKGCSIFPNKVGRFWNWKKNNAVKVAK